MFRIRRIYDDLIPRNKKAVTQVLEILKTQFPLLTEKELAKLPDRLRDPLKHRFRSVLFVADNLQGDVRGFALLMYDPRLNFCYLDYISTGPGRMGGGIGGALYQRVRAEARTLEAVGIFFECLPDDPELCRDPEVLKSNAARLRFYERFGARPIAGTAYETPVKPGDDNPPYLVFDGLGKKKPLRRKQAKKIVRAILERTYPEYCPPEYVRMVVDSIKDDPVRLRPPRYVKHPAPAIPAARPSDRRIALVINDRQAVHHVRERGYVESPVRIRTILKELDKTDCFEKVDPEKFPDSHIKAVHDPDFVDYIKKVCSGIEHGESVYPYVFPVRNAARPPKELAVRAGYYCIDTFTPLNPNAYTAARRAVDCAMTAADCILAGYRVSYALVRPPGHHAEKKAFGGFCYYNSAAVAAHYLSSHGKVAILDIDYHHGNGQQDIFYSRKDVLTISIHGNPRFAYPYFSGFEDEEGEGEGEGFNWNIPLPERVNGQRHHEVVRSALRRIVAYGPEFLIVALGFDTARNDPTGSWDLLAKDFLANGESIGRLHLPTLVVQEGGYNNRVLGINARHFFTGLWESAYG